MSEVNKYQPGGDHYKANIQHWDWALSNNMGYLTAAASKYVTRWRKKDGIESLRKAAHYTEKALEGFANKNVDPISVEDFAAANDLTYTEKKICEMLAFGDAQSLRLALAMIDSLCEQQDSANPQAHGYVNQG